MKHFNCRRGPVPPGSPRDLYQLVLVAGEIVNIGKGAIPLVIPQETAEVAHKIDNGFMFSIQESNNVFLASVGILPCMTTFGRSLSDRTAEASIATSLDLKYTNPFRLFSVFNSVIKRSCDISDTTDILKEEHHVIKKQNKPERRLHCSTKLRTDNKMKIKFLSRSLRIGSLSA